MVERVWYKPPAGKKVPRDPTNMPDDYFPPNGDWTPRSNFIQRQIMRGDGELIEGGLEHLGPGPETAARPVSDRAPISKEDRVAAANQKLGYKAPLEAAAEKKGA